MRSTSPFSQTLRCMRRWCNGNRLPVTHRQLRTRSEPRNPGWAIPPQDGPRQKNCAVAECRSWWRSISEAVSVRSGVRMSRQEAFRFEVVIVTKILGAEWTDLVYSDRLFQPVPAEEFTKERFGVGGLRISQYPGVFAERDEP